MVTKRFIILAILSLISIVSFAQGFDHLFTTYKPVYTPPRPVYVAPTPNIVENSITYIDNSYRPSTSSVSCVNSQTESGQILMIDNTTNSSSIVDAEVLFKSYSNNTISITITRLKLEGKWYPMNIDVITLSSLLDSVTGSDRNGLLELMKNFNFFGSSEDVVFLF